MNDEQYRRACYLKDKMHDVATSLRHIKENEDTLIVGYLSKETHIAYEDIVIQDNDEFIFSGLKKLLEDYQAYLKKEFAKL